MSSSSEWADILPDEYTYTRMRFSSIAGSSNCFFDLTAYASTEEEFQQQEAEDLSLLIQYGIDDILSWMWEGVLSFVELIPLSIISLLHEINKQNPNISITILFIINSSRAEI